MVRGDQIVAAAVDLELYRGRQMFNTQLHECLVRILVQVRNHWERHGKPLDTVAAAGRLKMTVGFYHHCLRVLEVIGLVDVIREPKTWRCGYGWISIRFHVRWEVKPKYPEICKRGA